MTSIVISDRCVEAIEERNSGGGRIVVHSEEDCIDKFCRFRKASGLNRSVGEPWNRSEQGNQI